MRDTERERKRETETQAEGEAGFMHREPDVGFDPESSGSCPGPKAGAKPLRHPGIPHCGFNMHFSNDCYRISSHVLFAIHVSSLIVFVHSLPV